MQQTLAGEFADGRKVRAGAQLKSDRSGIQYGGKYLQVVHRHIPAKSGHVLRPKLRPKILQNTLFYMGNFRHDFVK